MGGRTSTSFKPGCSGNPSGLPKDPNKIRAAEAVADVRALAKQYTREAIEALVRVMRDKKSPPAAVALASSKILDRGWGTPTQTVEASVSIMDQMSDSEQRALIEALAALREAEGRKLEYDPKLN